MKDDLVIALVKKMRKAGLTIATAESITGGGLGERFTTVAGSSEIYLGGVITYSDASKSSLLSIPRRTITKESAVSEVVARQMAENVRTLFKADFGIAATGVAGPGKAYGQRAGTAWIAIASKRETLALQLALSGDRAAVRQAVNESAIAAFARILSP